jgi:hypothetical protein
MGLAIFGVLLALTQAPAAVAVQTTGNAGTNRPAPPRPAAPVAAPQKATTPASNVNQQGGVHDEQPPHITVTVPPPVPLTWELHEKIAWAANLVLVILGYAGILLAISLLKKIDRQTGYAETAAEAAAASAQAALLNAQAVMHSERPWILISVEPSRSVENSFTVMATNRGRTPARILATAEVTRIAIDEKHLSSTPEYRNEKPVALVTPVILLSGESTAIKLFRREDVRGLCDSEERFKLIETWEEKIFLYGKVIYGDLIAPAESQAHETNWCCWYIHGRQNSGLVVAGPPEYNTHT